MLLSVGLLLGTLACAGGEGRSGSDTTTNVPSAAPPPAGGSVDVASITPQMLATGDSIFHGRAAGGLCSTCHGTNGTGMQLGPNLADSQWLNIDGSYAAIAGVITAGVPSPKQFPAPMPPMGGGSLTPEQVKAVAAYVYSLSHPEVRRSG